MWRVVCAWLNVIEFAYCECGRFLCDSLSVSFGNCDRYWSIAKLYPNEDLVFCLHDSAAREMMSILIKTVQTQPVEYAGWLVGWLVLFLSLVQMSELGLFVVAIARRLGFVHGGWS